MDTTWIIMIMTLLLLATSVPMATASSLSSVMAMTTLVTMVMSSDTHSDTHNKFKYNKNKNISRTKTRTKRDDTDAPEEPEEYDDEFDDEFDVKPSMLIEEMLADYDPTITPTFNDADKPTIVNVSLFINSIDSVNEASMDFSLNVFLTQTWVDERLGFWGAIPLEYLELDSKLTDKFWVPDLYFANEKRSDFHSVTVPNRLIHLYEDGRIVYKLRIRLTATCYMNLHRFPMDKQTCRLSMKSFGYSTNRLQFYWLDKKPIGSMPDLQMSQFSLSDMSYGECGDDGSEAMDNKNFTCLAVDLKLRRSIGFYMIQLYIPSVLIVALSWVSFALDVEAVPARISLGILTVLTMTNMKTVAVSSLPKVSYIKAMDVWMATCLAFVFASLVEFAVVNAIARRPPRGASGTCNTYVPAEGNGQVIVPLKPVPHHDAVNLKPNLAIAQKIDQYCLIAFPVAFFLFCVVYTLFYM